MPFLFAGNKFASGFEPFRSSFGKPDNLITHIKIDIFTIIRYNIIYKMVVRKMAVKEVNDLTLEGATGHDKIIYRIELPDRAVYIGQATGKDASKLERINQHIRNTYYADSTTKESVNSNFDIETDVDNLYNYIRSKRYRIQDLTITVYWEDIGFGISDFKTAFTEFTKWWKPAGNYLTNKKVTFDKDGNLDPNGIYDKDGKIIPALASEEAKKKDLFDKRKLDFAEIYHILKAQEEGFKVLNKEMGGKIDGYVFYSDVNNPNAVKVWRKTYSPKEALALCYIEPNVERAIAVASDEMYNTIFDKDWTKNTLKKMEAGELGKKLSLDEIIARTPDDMLSKQEIKENLEKDWEDFWQTTVLSKFIDLMVQGTKQTRTELKLKDNSKPNLQIKVNNAALIKKELKPIIDKWFYARSYLAKVVLRQKLNVNSKYIKHKYIVKCPDFDFTELINYVDDILARCITDFGYIVAKGYRTSFKTETKIGYLTNEKSRVHLKSAFKFQQPKNALRAWSLNPQHRAIRKQTWFNHSLTNGKELSREWKMHRSYLLFDYAFKQISSSTFIEYLVQQNEKGEKERLKTKTGRDRYTRKTVSKNKVLDDIEKSSYFDRKNREIPYIRSYADIEPSMWLGHRLNLWYAQHAPGYCRNWWEFYRPMVSIWRIYRGMSPIEARAKNEDDEDTIYVSKPFGTRDVEIWYKSKAVGDTSPVRLTIY